MSQTIYYKDNNIVINPINGIINLNELDNILIPVSINKGEEKQQETYLKLSTVVDIDKLKKSLREKYKVIE